MCSSSIERLFASKLNAEMRRASVRSGHQLTDLAARGDRGAALEEWKRAIAGQAATPGCQPVVTAVATRRPASSTGQAVASDLFAFAVSFVGAALRLRLTDHRQAQVMLRAIGPVIEQVTADAVGRDLDDIGGCAPMADIMSAQHERAEARLFAS